MTRGRNPPACIGESGPGLAINKRVPGIGPRVMHRDARGQAAGAVGRRDTRPAEQFVAPHGVAIDSRGDICVGEVSRTAMPNRGMPIPPAQDIRCMQKLVKLP